MQSPDLKLSPLALAAMLLASAAAQAQNTPATENADAKLPTVVVSASADASA